MKKSEDFRLKVEVICDIIAEIDDIFTNVKENNWLFYGFEGVGTQDATLAKFVLDIVYGTVCVSGSL